MHEFDSATLIAYTLGELPAEAAAAVARSAKANESLSAKLRALSACAGMRADPAGVAVLREERGTPRRPIRMLRRLAASVLAIACLCGMGYAGYAILRERPLFEDNFRDEWLDSRIWDTHRGRKGISEEGGSLRLLNRGSVVTKMQFLEPVELELDWMWFDLVHNPLYCDNLIVGLRTTGRHEDQHAYKLLDGVEVTFNVHDGAVFINRALAPSADLKVSAPGEMKFVAGKWYHLRITDDGSRVAVYVSGPEIDVKYKNQPVIESEAAGSSEERRVAFFNREYLAGANHESRIDNVVIRRYVPK